jgi:hypothetical protein
MRLLLLGFIVALLLKAIYCVPHTNDKYGLLFQLEQALSAETWAIAKPASCAQKPYCKSC